MEALKGVRILDMTHVQAGPTCSQLLAWMGADVIKFEPPQGDATRGQLRDVPKADSLYFTMLNCNKRSITVNMKNTEGKAVFVTAQLPQAIAPRAAVAPLRALIFDSWFDPYRGVVIVVRVIVGMLRTKVSP